MDAWMREWMIYLTGKQLSINANPKEILLVITPTDSLPLCQLVRDLSRPRRLDVSIGSGPSLHPITPPGIFNDRDPSIAVLRRAIELSLPLTLKSTWKDGITETIGEFNVGYDVLGHPQL